MNWAFTLTAAGREPVIWFLNAGCCTLGGAVVKKIAFYFIASTPNPGMMIKTLQLVITTIQFQSENNINMNNLDGISQEQDNLKYND